MLNLLKKSEDRKWRTRTHQPFANYYFEEGVIVAPSNVHGLGLFTGRAFRDGEQVGLYSGECVECVAGNKSKYLLEAEWYNRYTDKKEKWHIDSAERDNVVWTTACRYINDPCSTYTNEDYSSGKVPRAYRTEFSVTCKYGTTMSEYVHPVIRQYTVPVYAHGDLPAGVELLTPYGTDYWARYLRYFKGHDPNIKLNSSYDDSAWLANLN